MVDLYYFVRTPPGIDTSKVKELKPQSTDIKPEYFSAIIPEAIRLYDNGKFLYTIPVESLESWRETDQLQSLLDMIVKLDWYNYGIQQWRILTDKPDMQEALIRETYFISPKALGDA